MEKIEGIQRYVERTDMKGDRARYDMSRDDLAAFHEMAQRGLFETLCLVFNYGQAKGYRMARKEHQT